MATIPFNVGAAAQGNMQLPNKDEQRSTALKLFTGEVMTAFRKRNIFLDLITKKTIESGISKQFIITGAADESDVQDFNRGDKIAIADGKNDEITINVGERVTYSRAVDKLDEKLAHYDERAELAFQAVEVISTKIDKKIATMLCDSAAAVAHSTAYAAVNMLAPVLVEATGYTAATGVAAKGDALVEAIFALGVARQENDLYTDPTLVCAPKTYAELVQSSKAIHGDFTTANGGIDSGKFKQINGLPLRTSNHLPAQVAGKDLKILAFDAGAFGVVEALGMHTEADYVIERLAEVMVTSIALGYGYLNTGKIGWITAD